MASQAVPLQPPVRRGWTSTPHSYFKSLPRRLSPVAHQILGIILDDTIGAWPRREWTAAKHAYFAFYANCTVDAAQKATKRLAALRLVETRRAGQGIEYRPLVENFETPPEREARHFSPEALENLRANRKGPTVAIQPHFGSQSAGSTVSPELASPAAGLELLDSLDPARLPGSGTIKIVENSVDREEIQEVAEHHPEVACPHCGQKPTLSGFASPSPSNGAKAELGESIPCAEAGFSQAVEAARELEEFCLETITPRMGSVPGKKVLTAALQTLGASPVAMLTARITQRLELFEGPKASWGALRLLAEDVAKAQHALKKMRGRAPVVSLGEHWRSAAEIRRLHRDSSTPEHLKREILLMWPELKGTGARSAFADGFAEFLRTRK
jgi:hypothetical protein